MAPPPALADLRRIVDELSPTLLTLVAGDLGSAQPVENVVLYTPGDELTWTRGAFVLGAGVHDGHQAAALLRDLTDAGAAALVVRASIQVSGELEAVLAESPVVVLTIAEGASWVHLIGLLLNLLTEHPSMTAEPGTLGGLPSGDLFAVANAIAALVDAPVTIEDRGSRVLAFSGRQEEADQSRMQTILGRQVPDDYVRSMEQRGVFQLLYREEGPIYVEPFGTGDRRVDITRVAIAVRAGDEFLGSIWAAVNEPLSAEREAGLRDAAKVVALHVLRMRAGADVQRRLHGELVSAALTGGPAASGALDRLGLSGRRLMVMGLGVVRRTDDFQERLDLARSTAERQWLHDAFAVHVAATHLKAATAAIGGTSYAILPVVGTSDAAAVAHSVATRFLHRAGSRVSCHIAISNEATDVGELQAARTEVDRALRVLRLTHREPTTARVDDVQSTAMLLDLADLYAARGSRAWGPIQKVEAYDREHGTTMMSTLEAWLDSFGDVAGAAEAVHAHPNTIRYRIRRIAEIAGLDLDDPTERLTAMLHLRLRKLTDGTDTTRA